MAPSLLELKKEKKSKANDVSSSCGYAVRESLTLSQMMTLPEVRIFGSDFSSLRWRLGKSNLL